ncbi:hypothetical protein GCM10028790_45850 [Micromonospora taraxaci]
MVKLFMRAPIARFPRGRRSGRASLSEGPARFGVRALLVALCGASPVGAYIHRPSSHIRDSQSEYGITLPTKIG